jgi:hypothetical protein
LNVGLVEALVQVVVVPSGTPVRSAVALARRVTSEVSSLFRAPVVNAVGLGDVYATLAPLVRAAELFLVFAALPCGCLLALIVALACE